MTGPPAPTPPGCQTGGVLREALSGATFNGRTPRGSATSDESKFSGCGGFSILSAQVSNVSVPDGTVLWVILDFKAVGMITLRQGAGTMARYNMGRFGVSRDQVRVSSALPDVGTAQQILIGGVLPLSRCVGVRGRQAGGDGGGGGRRAAGDGKDQLRAVAAS